MKYEEFKAGDKVKLTNIHDIVVYGSNFTLGNTYTVFADSEDDRDSVRVTDDNGNNFGLYKHRFEKVGRLNGVGVDGKPKQFDRSDLKNFQRVVTAKGKKGIIATEGCGSYGAIVLYDGGGFDPAQINGEYYPTHPEVNIVEVYDNPGYSGTLDQSDRGKLLWKAVDNSKLEAQRKADAAVAEAEVALAAAKAARAAL